MPFARLWVDVRVDPRWHELPAKDRADAKALHLDAIQYSAEMLANGQINFVVASALCVDLGIKSARKVCENLLRIHVWKELRRNVFEIVDWERFHSGRAEVERQRGEAAERKRRSRSQMSLDVTHDVTEKSQRDNPAVSQRDEGVTPARARAGGQQQIQRHTDLPTAVPNGAAPENQDTPEPAAAGTEVEAPRHTRIVEVVDEFAPGDSDSINHIEPLAVQLPSDVFEQLVEKTRSRRQVRNKAGFLVDSLRNEIAARIRRNALDNAIHRSDIAIAHSPIEEIKRDHPDHYLEAMAGALSEADVEAYLQAYIDDEDRRIELFDRWHDARATTA